VRDARPCSPERRSGLPRRIERAASLLGLTLLTACAAAPVAEPGRTVDAEVLDLSRATTALGQELSALRAELARVRADLQTLQGGLQERSRAGASEVERQDDAIRDLDRRLTAREREAVTAAETLAALEATVGGLGDHIARLESLATQPAPERRDPPTAQSAPAPRPRPAALGAEGLLERATESLRAGELGQAVLDLEEFLAKYPEHPRATSAKFWIAEAYFRAREFAQAAVEYQKVIDDPPGDRTADALLKLGLAQRAVRRDDRARETWARLIRDYPDSEAAQRARAALREPAQPPVR
jgi:tol-pal system protein YbgF